MTKRPTEIDTFTPQDKVVIWSPDNGDYKIINSSAFQKFLSETAQGISDEAIEDFLDQSAITPEEIAVYSSNLPEVADDIEDGQIFIFDGVQYQNISGGTLPLPATLPSAGFAPYNKTRTSVIDCRAIGDGVSDDAPAIQKLVDDTELNGGSYIYLPTFEENYLVSTAINFMLGDIRVFGDKGLVYTHPFADGTDRLFRRGNLVGATSAREILNLGDDKTRAGRTPAQNAPYTANDARNLAMSWTVDHLTLRGEGTKEVDGIRFSGNQNGPDRIVSVDTVSGYNLRAGIHIPVNAAATTIQLANLRVTNSSFNFGDYGVFSLGRVFGASFVGCNFEANSEGCVHGVFNGSVTVENNMSENTKNPYNFEPTSNLILRAGGNYFEFHPTSDYLYRVRGDDSFLIHDISILGDIITSGIPDYTVQIANAGRFKINVENRHTVLIKDVPQGETVVIGKGSNILGPKGKFNIDGIAGTIVADVEGVRPDINNVAIHSYPHDPATYTLEQTPLGVMPVVDLFDGIRVEHGENILNKLVLSTFLIRSTSDRDVDFPPSPMRSRTFAGGFIINNNAPLDYIANDISQGEWRMVSVIWRGRSSVANVEFYHDEAGEFQVAGVVTQVIGPYAGDGTDPIMSLEPYTLNALAVETGTNANGTWVKYPDGRLECTQSFAPNTASTATNTIQGLTVYRNDTPWTFPLAFIAPPKVFHQASQNAAAPLISGRALSVTPTAALLRSDSLVNYASFGVTKSGLAIGRWKV